MQNPLRYPEAEGGDLVPWLRAVVAEVAPQATGLAVRLTGDREMRVLNRRFRGRDRATDVLSFPGEPGADDGYLGDVAISVPTARRQAKEAGHGARRELRILILHGVLHCLGHDHETDGGAMQRLEARLRRRWVPR